MASSYDIKWVTTYWAYGIKLYRAKLYGGVLGQDFKRKVAKEYNVRENNLEERYTHYVNACSSRGS